jgi:uncharacterized protein YkwD
MKFLFSILFIGCSILSSAQLSDKEATLLTEILTAKINDLRLELKLKKLTTDSSLASAAKMHSSYMARYNKLSHNQARRKTKTAALRVKQYSNDFEIVGENILNIQEKKKRIKDIEATANKMYLMWKDSPGHYKNMVNPDFDLCGLGFTKNKRGYIYATHVLGKKGIRIPGQLSKNSFNIKPESKSCDDLLLGKKNLIVNLGNSVNISWDDTIRLYHHNNKIIEELLVNKKDGISIDLIDKDQFSCNNINQLDMSPIYDGIMLKPIYKSEIFSRNKSKNDLRLIVPISFVPEKLKDKQLVPNLIFIKEGRSCSYIIPSMVPRGNYELLHIKPKVFEPKNVKFRTRGIASTTELVFDFERGKVKPTILKYADFSTNNISKIEITGHSSVEGDSITNDNLHQERAKYIKDFLKQKWNIKERQPELSSSENWTLCYLQLEMLGLDSLLNKSKETIRRFIRNDTTYNWDSLLFIQRKSYASIHYRESWNKTNSNHFDNNLRTALLETNIELANRAIFHLYKNERDPSWLYDPSMFKVLLLHPGLVQNTAAWLSTGTNLEKQENILYLKHWLTNICDLSHEAVYNLLILYTKTYVHDKILIQLSKSLLFCALLNALASLIRPYLKKL